MTSLLLAMVIVGASADLSDLPWPKGWVKVEAKTEKKRQWPPVCINVLGYKECVPCREMYPAIRALKRDGIPIYYWDIRKHPKLMKQTGVKYGYPSIALLIDGKIVQQHDGVVCEAELRHLYQRGLSVRAGKGKLDPAKRYTKTE